MKKPKHSKEYMAGFDAGQNGPNETNCNFRNFATPAQTKEWEKGNKAGLLNREPQSPTNGEESKECTHRWKEKACERRVAGYKQAGIFTDGLIWYEMRVLQECEHCGKYNVVTI